MRSTAVSSVCASESREIASATTSSRERVRSSSSSTSRDALGRAQGVSGARRERRERGQVGLGRRDILREEELQRGERRLPERQGRDLRRARVVGEAGGAPLLDRLDDDRGGTAETRLDGTERGDELRPLLAEAPESSSAGAGRLDGDADCLLRGAARIAAGCESLAGELEPVGADARPGDLRSQRPHGERELPGGEPRERALVVVELVADPDQLDRADDVTAGPRRQREQTGCPGLSRRPAGRLGRLPGRDGLGEPPRPGHLGAERRAGGRDRARGEAPLVVEDPQNRQIGARRVGDCRGNRLQSDPQLRGFGHLGRRLCQALDRQPLGIDDHPGRSIAYNPGMPAPAHKATAVLDEDPPSLDPRAIEQNYRRERARRRARTERRSAVKRSNVRFWVSLLVLAFVAAFALVAAWNEIQTLFGV